VRDLLVLDTRCRDSSDDPFKIPQFFPDNLLAVERRRVARFNSAHELQNSDAIALTTPGR
jgi:hypothetical protein